MLASDRELLRAFKAGPAAATFSPFVERYGNFVLSTALRQTPNQQEALETTRAVFLAFARRARKLNPKTVLALWLGEATSLACRKWRRTRQARTGVRSSESQTRGPDLGTSNAELRTSNLELQTPNAQLRTDAWARISVPLDDAIRKLPVKVRGAVVLRAMMGWPLDRAAVDLRTSARRVEKRAAQGIRLLARRLRKRKLLIGDEDLEASLRVNGCAASLPSELQASIVAEAQECFRHRPKLPLARSILRRLAWERWKWRLRFVGKGMAVAASVVAVLAITGVLLWRTGRLLPWLIEFGARQQLKNTPELAEPARPWPGTAPAALSSAAAVENESDIYGVTNIWPAHLHFTAQNWQAMTPKRIPPVPRLMQPDGTILLRNPKARRNGLAAAMGIEFEWTHADLEFGGTLFTNVGCRFRGNGTFVNSMYGLKRPLKIELNRFAKEQRLARVRTLNLANLVVDTSCLSDALAYEFFRESGIPAPRTAYAYITLSVEGKMAAKPLGLYLLIEDVDSQFAAERFGGKKAAIFKPVTYDLFKDLGADWAAYAPIYDPKNKPTQAQQQRVIDFARFVTHADDAAFARDLPQYLDLREFARFLSGMVLLSSYDGFLSNGQNFYIYIDPNSDQFGFIPWDLDNAWGSFPFVGTSETRERASIWHPCAGPNPFLDRVLKVEAFRTAYRAALEEQLAHLFVPDRLEKRIDEIAGVIRSPITAESTYRLRRFEQSVSTNWVDRPKQNQDGATRPVHQIKPFIMNRAKSVRDQLDGKSDGVTFRAKFQ